jgi:hypothetical protein
LDIPQKFFLLFSKVTGPFPLLVIMLFHLL